MALAAGFHKVIFKHFPSLDQNIGNMGLLHRGMQLSQQSCKSFG